MVAAGRNLPAPPELVGRWQSALEEGGLRPRILELADRFPEERSLEVPFAVLDSSDTALGDLLLERPEEVLVSGQRAMRELLPVAGPESEGLRLRVTGLPPTARKLIRAIREGEVGDDPGGLGSEEAQGQQDEVAGELERRAGNGDEGRSAVVAHDHLDLLPGECPDSARSVVEEGHGRHREETLTAFLVG